MSGNLHEPSAWPKFLGTLDRGRSIVTEKAFAFSARWRFASSFKGIEAEGYKSDRIVDGYHALLKVLLACTAWEQLASLLGKNKYKVPLDEADLVSRVREVLCPSGEAQFAKSVLKTDDSGIGDDFISGKTNNLIKLAFAIRNGVAHGSITPSGSGIDVAKRIEAVNELADAVLAHADAHFTQWVDEYVALGSTAPAS